MLRVELKRKISKVAVERINKCSAILIGVVIGLYFIINLGLCGLWMCPLFLSVGLLFPIVWFILFFRLINRILFKRLLAFILLCAILIMPLFVSANIFSYQSIAQNIATEEKITHFKNLLGRNYNYTELIVWENQQLNFSGAQRNQDPIKIFESHQGKCGEFAILYATLCISQGYRCRIISNVFNDHAFNEVLLPNGTWIRVDASLNSTGPRAIGYPMFFENEDGWMPPLLSLAFEDSTITEVTRIYRSDGFEVYSLTTLIVLISLIAFVVITIRSELLNPKSRLAEESASGEEEDRKIKDKEEKERDKLIYDIVVRRYDQELKRTSDLDSKANNIIGFSGLLATLIATVVSFLLKGQFTILFVVPLSLLIISVILGLLAFRVKTYEVIQPREFIDEYNDKSFSKTLREYASTIADNTLNNHKVHEEKAKLIKYATSLLTLAITLFFVIVISNWLI